MSVAIEQLQAKFRDICAAIGASYKFNTAPQHDGSAHVEVEFGIYSYVMTERGTELERRITESQDETLYWLTSDAVFIIACQFELNNRIAGQDTRRLMFAKNLALLALVSPAWAERKDQEHQEILAKYPYIDPIAC
ncbi:MAG: Imm63 family immunity protein [Methylophilaceae bacterium]